MGYYTRLKAMWDKLWSYCKVPNCVCGAAAEFVKEKEEERVHQFLMGLNDEFFGTIRSQILAMDPLPSIGRAYAMVIQEEKHKSVTRGREDKSDTVAFAVYARGRDRNQQQREENKSTCTHCGKYGHDVSDCFQINGYPPNWGSRGTGRGKGKRRGSGRGNGRGGTSVNAVAAAINVGNGQQTGVTKGGGETIQGLGFTPDQVQQILALIEQSPSRQEKLTGNTSDLFTEGQWLLDMGASHHVTGYMKLLIDIHEKSLVTVGLPNGAKIIATKHGKARAGENIILQDVLFVPSLRCNLISVGQLMRELNCIVTFSPNLCVIQDRSMKNLIGVGELEDGVYYLRTRKGEKALKVTSSIRGELWHRRMGHPSSQISNFLSSLVGSVLAYANSNTTGNGRGCLLWYGDLIDIKRFPESANQNLYNRVAASELDSRKKRKLLLVMMAAAVASVLLLIASHIIWKKRTQGAKSIAKQVCNQLGPAEFRNNRYTSRHSIQR
ncbi:hypothetical protein F0562_018963 [Nyssa sinensis]|uniref:CCHC-type domain-containing protein n=1 Tax=Nyssa sinensis TaxID=561372 RepID=A0A5J4ZCH2_9ASTE|nr:hypothetical protein F0562_018963 [Nyssa sinensis]